MNSNKKVGSVIRCSRRVGMSCSAVLRVILFCTYLLGNKTNIRTKTNYLTAVLQIHSFINSHVLLYYSFLRWFYLCLLLRVLLKCLCMCVRSLIIFKDEEKEGKCYSGSKPDNSEITAGMKKECGDMEIVFVRLGHCPDEHKGRSFQFNTWFWPSFFSINFIQSSS